MRAVCGPRPRGKRTTFRHDSFSQLADPDKRDCQFPRYYVALGEAELLGAAGTLKDKGNLARFAGSREANFMVTRGGGVREYKSRRPGAITNTTTSFYRQACSLF